MMGNKVLGALWSLIIFSSGIALGQSLHYQREILGIKDAWHSIELPQTIYAHIKADYSDLRVYGITNDGDTLEAPFILRSKNPPTRVEERQFKVINKSKAKGAYFVTFAMSKPQTINQVGLDFEKENFDWHVSLEGGHDQKEWFEIVQDYRIVSIKNGHTNYQFTTIYFQDVNFPYIRLKILEKQDLGFVSARLSMKEAPVIDQMNVYKDVKWENTYNKDTKRSRLYIHLASPVAVSCIQIGVSDTVDYFRPFTLQYLRDSFETEKGWKYQYGMISGGTLSSFDENNIKFDEVITNGFLVQVDNYDDAPLTFAPPIVKGDKHELVVRIDDKSRKYFLCYGDKDMKRPKYDISYFEDKIPDQLATLILGMENEVTNQSKRKASPLLVEKWWLWAIMALIIVTLGWFVMKMMKEAGAKEE